MKTKNNFTIGVLSGVCITLFLFIIMGSTSPNETAKFEFYDLKDTRGLIFNKVTGEMEYKEIRENPLQYGQGQKIWGNVGVYGINSSGHPRPLEIVNKD